MVPSTRNHTAKPAPARGLAAAAGLVLLWELLGRLLELPSSSFPVPSRIAVEIAQNWDRLGGHAPDTALAAGGGLLAGGALASLLLLFGAPPESPAGGVLLAAARLLERLPIVLAAPLVSAWMGVSFRPKLILAAVVAFAPVAHLLGLGLSRLDPALRDMIRQLGGTRQDEVLRLLLPAGLPWIVAGARRGATPALVAATLADLAGAGDRGLGYVLLAATTKLDMPMIFASLTLLALVSLLLHGAIALAERALRGAGFSSDEAAQA
jgi:ABC-type nitrate/sulfonate/bicarbonate transport system permease component